MAHVPLGSPTRWAMTLYVNPAEGRCPAIRCRQSSYLTRRALKPDDLCQKVATEMEKPNPVQFITSVFALVVIFFVAANTIGPYIGGGDMGLLAAVVIAIAAGVAWFLIYGDLLKRFRRRGQPQEIPIGPPPQASASIPKAPAKFDIGPTPKTIPPKPPESPSKKAEGPKVSQPSEVKPQRWGERYEATKKEATKDVAMHGLEGYFGKLMRAGPRRICDPGPHLVEARSFLPLELNILPGVKVVGRIIETDGQPFDWLVLDEKELVRLHQGNVPKSLFKGRDESAYAVDWVFPAGGLWFLVLDMYQKVNDRVVEVHLR